MCLFVYLFWKTAVHTHPHTHTHPYPTKHAKTWGCLSWSIHHALNTFRKCQWIGDIVYVENTTLYYVSFLFVVFACFSFTWKIENRGERERSLLENGSRFHCAPPFYFISFRFILSQYIHIQSFKKSKKGRNLHKYIRICMDFNTLLCTPCLIIDRLFVALRSQALVNMFK